jgi:hypothetical protein
MTTKESTAGIRQQGHTNALRPAGYAGIAFFAWLVVAAVVFNAVLPMPTFADSPNYIRVYYTDHGRAVLLHAWLSGVFWSLAFLLFAAGLRRHLESEPHEDQGIWPGLSTIGATLAVAFGGVGLIFQTVAVGVARDTSGDLLTVLARMMVIADATLLYWGLALFAGAVSISAFRSGSLRAPLAWMGLTSALLMVIGASWPLTGDDRGAIASAGLAGLTLLGVWVLFASRSLLRDRK